MGDRWVIVGGFKLEVNKKANGLAGRGEPANRYTVQALSASMHADAVAARVADYLGEPPFWY